MYIHIYIYVNINRHYYIFTYIYIFVCFRKPFPTRFVHSWQTKNSLKKFLDNLLQKSGKIRGLIREIKENYQSSTTMQSCAPHSSPIHLAKPNEIKIEVKVFAPIHAHMLILLWPPLQGMCISWRHRSRRWTNNTMHATAR